MKKKNKPTDWLTPKQYKPDEQSEQTPDEKLEKTLRDIQDSIDRNIEEQKKLRSKADDAGQFGEYRYRDGMIAGLTYATEVVSDYLSEIWG
jgi:hypothetical protein